MMKRRDFACILLITLSSGAIGKPKPAAVMALLLKPMVGSDGAATGIEVEQTLPAGMPAARVRAGMPRDFSLVAPVNFEGVKTIADRIVGLSVRDAAGPVPLTVYTDPAPPGESNTNRHWRAQRPVRYPVTIRYVSQVQPAGAPEGPPMGLRPAGGGLAASGGGFLLLPEVATTGTAIRWDLSSLPRGSIGVVSAGEGATFLPGPPATLNDQWFLAGPAGRYDATPQVPLHAYWLGTPPFDAHKEMVWAGKAYGYLGKRFAYLNPVPPYRIFIKQLDTRPFGGGTALPGAFLLSTGRENPKGRGMSETHLTFIHEMAHQWVGHMATEQRWFNEGLTDYYTGTYGLDGGLLTRAEYLLAIRTIANNYYRSPGRAWTEARIATFGYTDESIRLAQYGRGSLYFANLHATLLAASQGRSGLDRFMRPLFERRAAGVPLTLERFEGALRRALGEQAVRDFRAEMIDVTTPVVPRPDIFGRCYAVVPTPPVPGAGDAAGGYTFDETGAAGCGTSPG
jgi:hypothetical protein